MDTDKNLKDDQNQDGEGKKTTADTDNDSKDFASLRKKYEAEAKAKKDLEAKLAKYEAEKAEDTKKKLEEQGKWKELAEAKEKEIADYKAKIAESQKQSAVEKALIKQGINPDSLDYALFKIGSQVKLSDTGELEGLESAITEFKTANAFVFAPEKPTPAGKVGAGQHQNTVTGGLSQTEIEAILKSGNAKLIAENAEKIEQSVKSI